MRISATQGPLFRFVDTKRWDDLRALFSDDAVIWVVEAYDEPQALDPSMKFMVDVLEHAVSVHSDYMPVIDIVDSDHAAAIWPMQDQLYWQGTEGNPFVLSQMTGAGHYHERYRREGGVWKIEYLKLTRLRRLALPLPSAGQGVAERP